MLGDARREAMKLLLRRQLQRLDLGIGRDPMMRRLQRMLAAASVETVLDVGANRGQYAALLRAAGFTGTIHSFEPLVDAYSSLAARAARDADWHVHHFALGSAPTRTDINVSANSYSSSLLPMTPSHLAAAPGSEVVGTEEVEVRTLDALVSELDLDAYRTLLKIDTQGYEAEVLAGAGSLLGKVAAIQLELSLVTLYEGQPLFDELRERMTELGLELVLLEPGIADAQGRMLQCDGVFLRRGRLSA